MNYYSGYPFTSRDPFACGCGGSTEEETERTVREVEEDNEPIPVVIPAAQPTPVREDDVFAPIRQPAKVR